MLIHIEITVLKVMVLGSNIYIFISLKKHRRTRSMFKEKCKYTLLCCLYTITNYNIMKIYSKMEQCYRGGFVSKSCHCCQRGRKSSFLMSKEGVANQCQRGRLLIKLTLLATQINTELQSLQLVCLNKEQWGTYL